MEGATPRRSTRRRLALSFAPVAILGLAAVACGKPEARRPDLLLVTVDSLRADFLECYGGEPGVGTRICALASGGARYTWAFAAASSSAPSVASILTSQYPSNHGVDASAASFLPEAAVTLAEELQRAGYATAAFVGSPELNRSRNLQQGFDLYDDRTARTAPAGLPWRSARDSTDEALRWIRHAASPWFVWVHYREPHGPYTSGAATEGPGLDAPTGPGERLSVLPTAAGRGGIPAYQAIRGLFTREGYEARYRREIRTVDGQLARLLAEIDRPGESLGILLTADHGEAFGEDRYYLSHGHSLGVDQIRVPLIWRRPRAEPEVIRVTVSTLDVMPTLLQAAGLAPPASVEGRKLPGGTEPPGAPEQARAVFAEHELYVAVASGGNLYTRLREPAAPVVPAMSAAYLRAVAARTVPLDRDAGPLPASEPARPSGITPLLEPLVADFLARSGRESGSGSGRNTRSSNVEPAFRGGAGQTPQGIETP